MIPLNPLHERSTVRAAFKAAILTIIGRNTAGSMRDAVAGYVASMKVKNVHDSFLQVCKVISTDPEGRKLWTTPLGDLWTPAGASAKYLSGIVAEQMLGFYSHQRIPEAKGEVILDCGANIGAFTRYALNCGAKRVIAMEPSSENGICFERNLAEEIRDGKVALMKTAVGDREGELWLDTSNAANPGSWSVSDRPPPSGQRIPITTVDRIVTGLNLTHLDRIKIDVEGCEVRAVKGAAGTIEKFRPRLVLAVEHEDQNSAQIVQELQATCPVLKQYRCHFGHYNCDDNRRLLPQAVYLSPRAV